ncbi:hypothetical protein [Cesiribacter sp. SM1]|uniref:hypothetical protein n=1 Tax=Cesiribacter sp. SM1 TaxID=2861196 RepID=UPI001CD25E6F|nr:hypothetical protein [Cesiribacter sp. SM1]
MQVTHSAAELGVSGLIFPEGWWAMGFEVWGVGVAGPLPQPRLHGWKESGRNLLERVGFSCINW